MHTFSDNRGLNFRLTSVQLNSTGIAYLIRTRADALGGFITTLKRRNSFGYADVELARGSTFEQAFKHHDKMLIDLRRSDDDE